MGSKPIGVSCQRGKIKFAECERCALTPTRPCHLTPDMLARLRTDTHDIPDNMYTPTMLLGCYRRDALWGQQTEHYIDAEGSWATARGTMIHSTFESIPAYPGVVAVVREVRFEVPIVTMYGMKRFGAKPDCIVVTRLDKEKRIAYLKIVDYKTTSEIGHDKTKAAEEHEMQLNMYAWVVEQCAEKFLWEAGLLTDADTVQVEELEILYGDMKKPRRFTSGATLKAKGKLVRDPNKDRGPDALPLIEVDGKWYEELTLDPIRMLKGYILKPWIIRHIELKEEAKTKLPPLIAEERRWMCWHCPVKKICGELAEAEIEEQGEVTNV